MISLTDHRQTAFEIVKSSTYITVLGLYETICSNLQILTAFFYWLYVSGLYPDMKNGTFPVSLGCLHKAVDDLLKLYNAAGLWISP